MLRLRPIPAAAGLAAIGALLLAAAAPAAAQAPPPGFKGNGIKYQILRGSNLRRGDRLLDPIAVTLWSGGEVVGSGDCGEGACPVTYNGQNLWARRSRLRLGGGTAPPPPAGAPVATRRLERGLKGDDVKALQEALNRNGATLTADGNFGSATRAAVEAFQRAKGLTADGVAGRGTLAALGFKVDY